ncbi:MAG: hypothetical protein RLZZ210_1792 [Pseudomonadota bacterium]|jgi:fructokinase
MSDILCLGEILVDWISPVIGAELSQAQTFTKNAGGAPANTAVGLARQGVDVGFIGAVSNDEFGKWLLSILEQENINTQGIVVDEKTSTRMAYVVTTKSGDRKLAEFSKIACADVVLDKSHLIESQFIDASILHFGSISLINNPCADATYEALKLARKHGLIISYDPNVRLNLWSSPQVCKQTILDTIGLADIVKINQEELVFLTGSDNIAKADELRKQYNIPLLIITLDTCGAYICTENFSKSISGFRINLVEATGAGDGFNAGVLFGILSHIKHTTNRRQKLIDLNVNQLEEIVNRANAIGAIICTKTGAMQSLPSKQEVDEFIQVYS